MCVVTLFCRALVVRKTVAEEDFFRGLQLRNLAVGGRNHPLIIGLGHDVVEPVVIAAPFDEVCCGRAVVLAGRPIEPCRS